MAIAIAKAGNWKSSTPEMAVRAKDLKPRKTEERKSAWAHVADNQPMHPHFRLILVGTVFSALPRLATRLLSLRPQVTRKLQAASLAVLSVHAQQKQGASQSIPSIYYLLSIRRSAITPADVVVKTRATHILDSYDDTHRELDLKDEARRVAVTESISAARNGFLIRDYTLDELRPLLTWLLKRRLVRDKYQSTVTLMCGADIG